MWRLLIVSLSVTTTVVVLLVWRAPISQWAVNTSVNILRGVGGIEGYIEENRHHYLTEAEAGIDVVGAVRASSPAELGSLRKLAEAYLWKGRQPLFGTVIKKLPIGKEDPVNTLPRISNVSAYKLTMKHGIEVRFLYLKTNVTPRSCLFLLHQDHNAIYLGERAWYQKFLSVGCDLIVIPMPITLQPLPVTVEYGGKILHLREHKDLFLLETSEFAAMAYFIQPTLAALQVATANGRYERIAATGLSGGGWTAMVVAALEPRITHLYSVAGSVPLYIANASSRNRGDYEQFHPPFYRTINYFELYLLGVLEPKRRAVHIYNRYDNCCYNGAITAGFSPQLEGIAKRWVLGRFRFRIDNIAKSHTISKQTLEFIVTDFVAN